MAKKNKEKKLKKTIGYFTLVGKAKVNDNTFSKDIISEKSGYKYSRLNLGVETKKGNTVYCGAMAGYFPGGKNNKGQNKDNIIRANTKEDFKTQFEIEFSDRHNKEILKSVHESNFIKIGVEKYDDNGTPKTYVKKFLTWYDAIPYLEEHLEDGTIINVKGNLNVNFFNDEVQIQKDVTSIFLSNATEDKFKSTFVMEIALEEDSIAKIDKETREYAISAKVIDYLKEHNGVLIKKNVPFLKTFYIKEREDNPEITKKMLKKFFKVDKDKARLIQVEGEFVEGLTTKEVDENDLSQDMLDLIEMGLYEKEELLQKMATNGDRVSKMYITKPYVKRNKQEDGSVKLETFIDDSTYTPQELIPSYLYFEEEEESTNEEIEENTDDEVIEDTSDDDDLSFLDEI